MVLSTDRIKEGLLKKSGPKVSLVIIVSFLTVY